MKRQYQTLALILFVFLLGTAVFTSKNSQNSELKLHIAPEAMAAKFDYLSQNGNSSCSANFQKSIPQMTDADHIRGSCCSPMSLHRYSEQVEGLKKYANIPEIPSDPYDIEASLAKKLISYYDMELTPQEQAAYDYAMENSHEKGPCCCKCWRWYVYGGLGKYLIRYYGFAGEQLTEVWNLSDGCGGDEEHNH
ncbi:MAG: hypothetical protein G01um101430_688 [Parcubacteria group bacterium Gr01-1014_30]|nr:MAG: hypothetical protein G01um101430_688 [Parcubacteria group bacterium Gr01-1014_30]